MLASQKRQRVEFNDVLDSKKNIVRLFDQLFVGMAFTNPQDLLACNRQNANYPHSPTDPHAHIHTRTRTHLLISDIR